LYVPQARSAAPTPCGTYKTYELYLRRTLPELLQSPMGGEQSYSPSKQNRVHQNRVTEDITDLDSLKGSFDRSLAEDRIAVSFGRVFFTVLI